MKKMPVYIVPGWTYQLDRWLPIAEGLKRAGLEVNLLSVPGLTGKELKRAWTLDDYAEWLRKELPGKGQVFLLAHSNGGRISLAYLEKYQAEGRVAKLILVDSAGLIDKRLKVRVKRSVFAAAAKMGKKLTKRGGLGEKILYKLARESDYRQATPVMKETMQNLIGVDLAEAAKKVKLPTLIIWGEDDSYTPLFQGREMFGLIAGAKLKIIKGAGHSPHFTHEPEVRRALVEFLD